MIKIRKPLCFTEIGKKDNQEDYLYPANADTNTRVFIMCDGMGGHDNGEVASMTAGSTLGDYLTSCSEIDIPTFETGLAKAYDALDSIDTNSSKKPGTTMTCLCLNENNYLVAHIGDSRIYHIRPSLYNAETKRGGILYQSSDHSLVNDLLKAGELSEEEAIDFPHKNIITRAMQPNMQKRYKSDVYTFDDIQGGDYFFLCCDGILEQLSNEVLCEILSDKKLDDKQKLAKIKSICDGNTRDNYTCWLVPIDKVSIMSNSALSQVIHAEVEDENGIKPKPVNPINQEDTETDIKKLTIGTISPTKSKISYKQVKRFIINIVIVITIILIGLFTVKYFSQERDTDKTKQTTKMRFGENSSVLH